MIPPANTQDFAVQTFEGLKEYIDHRLMMIDANADWDNCLEAQVATALKDELKEMRGLLG